MGIIYINGNDIKVLKDEKDINILFYYIPNDSMSEYDINNELKDIQIKPIKLNILENN